ncbi:TetR family transcriptional regulator [Herbiconiux sp. KACC 21604]|uniref:TetR/AcrR family transcriptional regulator n=1 Tax=unclassified Herbiconiux TaxID=2618217 RepID=UPI001492419E|nr:TetR family transcriptional regulator [Herbiconiux sp. SALV-R1]QJU55807.1 TetR family transcriptional regulator [Herbiconiux sp. SALV-R1]WPO87021.1 TetR family transcriptional regulator [Herbiconiux sp. KACC 21604]
MDPRYERTQQQLRHAVYRLAAERPVGEIGVAELCRAAGVTRDTFYRHAVSPTTLLAEALGDELTAAIEAVRDEHSGRLAPGERLDGEALMRQSERALLQHLRAHAAVYRNAMTVGLVPELRTQLERLIFDALVEHALVHPSILPEAIAPDDRQALEITAAYAASGTVGAVERWLRHDPLDVDRGAALILAASPAFWLRDP